MEFCKMMFVSGTKNLSEILAAAAFVNHDIWIESSPMKIINGLTQWCVIFCCLGMSLGCGTVSKVASRNHRVIGPGDAVPTLPAADVPQDKVASDPETEIADLPIHEQFLPPIDPHKFVTAPESTVATAPDPAATIQWHSNEANTGLPRCPPVAPPPPGPSDTIAQPSSQAVVAENAGAVSDCERRI